MSIIKDFLTLIEKIANTINIPLIEKVYFPPGNDEKCKIKNYGAIKLADDSIGLMYLNLNQEVKKQASQFNVPQLAGFCPLELAKDFASTDGFRKTLGLGAINAISQSVFRQSHFAFDFTTDLFGSLNLQSQDHVGMVGFFPPLVKILAEKAISLTVIEKKSQFIQKQDKMEVTLNPQGLSSCNKILITSTTILNDSIDEMLGYCKCAEKISVLGPMGGYIPDPLFKRNVEVLGGTYISDSKLFMDLVHQQKDWGKATRKYCLRKDQYPGLEFLLNKAKQNEKNNRHS